MLAFAFSAGGAVEPLFLVTEEEAGLPDPPLRGPHKELDGGPEIRVVSPENNAVYAGAFPIEVSFHVGPSGEPVDISTLQVTYRKAWGIDITSRLRRYLSLEDLTIKVPETRFPKGRHSVEIYIEDEGDNASSRTFSVEIQKS
ncbi:MAG: hypothetical protein ACQGVK_25720 [Myxococcota bacterium]